MPIKHGATAIGSVLKGTVAMARVYHGSTLRFDSAGEAPAGGSATLTIPSGKVASNLTNYPLYVSLANMPSSFWTTSNKGKDLRASVSGSQVPCDMVWYDKTNQQGTLFVLVPTVFASSSTVVTLTWDGVSDRAAVGSTFGRNAVWADFTSVFLLGETIVDDRTGGVSAAIYDDPDFFELIETSSTDLNSHQGVCWDGTYYYTVDTNAIYKWSSSWTLVDSNTNPIGDAAIATSPTVDHCGDPEYYDGKIYIPLECYPASGGLYNSHIVVFSAADLSFIASYDISAQAHESSSICRCDRDGKFYVTDYVAGAVHRYNPDFTYSGTLTLSGTIPLIQGITWWRDYFWISADDDDETYRVAFDGTMDVGNKPGVGFGSGVSGGYYEGIGHREDALLQVKDPGATERVEVWRPIRMPISAGGGFDDGNFGTLVANNRPSLTTFTLACTMAIASKGKNRVPVSYWDESAGTTNTRQVISYRDTGTTLAIWDTNNSWLNASPAINPTLNQAYRAHSVYNGTISRTLYVNGAQAATQAGIAAVPNALDTIRIMSEDTSELERWDGQVGFVYLRPGVLSAAWIAAEYSNLNAPGSFYSIT